MDKLTLFKLACEKAANESLTIWKDKKVFLLWDNKTEYTVCSEDNLATVMKAEPNLTNVGAFFNGKPITK